MRNRPIIKCIQCGQEKPHEAFRLCNHCYRQRDDRKQYQKAYAQRDYVKAMQREATHNWYRRNKNHQKPLRECQQCHEMKEHHAEGLCTACYEKSEQRKQNKKIAYAKYQHERDKDKVRQASLNYYHFNKMDIKHICQICGHKENLHVHHIDKDVFNNDMKNIQILCCSCHYKIHHKGAHQNETNKKLTIFSDNLTLEEFNKSFQAMSDAERYDFILRVFTIMVIAKEVLEIVQKRMRQEK